MRDFTPFYRAINEEDEATFTAKLTPSEGRVGAVSKGIRDLVFGPAWKIRN